MRTYKEEAAFMGRVADRLVRAGRVAVVEDTGGHILCVVVDHAGGKAQWYCGIADVNWGGGLVDAETGDGLDREFGTDVPSESDDVEAVAAALLRAIRLEEDTPDAPRDYAARVARWFGEDARTIMEHGTPGDAMDRFLETAAVRVAQAWQDGYKACLEETGLAKHE